MTADGVAPSAGGRPVLPPRTATGEIESFTQGRVERILVLVVAFGCAVLGTQAFLNALGSVQEDPRWHAPLLALAFVPLVLMLAASLIGRYVRFFAAAFAVAYPAVLLLWPVATARRVEHVTGEPWIWYLINVATVAATIAFPLVAQIVWAVFVPLLFGVVRLVQVELERDELLPVILDVVFALILAGVLVTLGWMLRSVAIGIDDARRDAVRSYAAAAAADAAEKERIAVAALMHDSVLAALIAAERASSPRERTLAASMARDALNRLANADQDAGEGPDAPVPASSVADGIEDAAREIGLTLTVDRALDALAPVPGRVARALVLAATQAIANALEHAGGAGLDVRVATERDGVTIRVADAGPGFDPDEVGDDRLGIRASILARMAAAGGRARIDSSPAGTVVVLQWRGSR